MSGSKGAVTLVLWLTATAAALAGPEPVADVLTLRDGARVLGELVETPGRTNVFLVRRAWAREHVPDWARKWEAAEQTTTARAIAQRRERLSAWRRDRALAPPAAAGADRITPWLDRELANLRPGNQGAVAPLMAVHLLPSDIQKVTRHPRGAAGMLRQAWLVGSRNPETLSVDTLKGELEGRGLDLSRPLTPTVDALLPPRVESDAVWLTRRAATELLYDTGLRYIQYQGLVMPDSGTGQPQGLPGLQSLPALGALLGEAPADPWPGQLRQLGSQGKAGALLTRLEIAPDFSLVTVEVSLWVRQGSERWQPAGSRAARVRPDDLGPDAGKDLADDPQIAMAFRLVEALGLHELGPELKRRTLSVGAATQKALGQARAQAQADLTALALPVLEHRGDDPKPAAKP